MLLADATGRTGDGVVMGVLVFGTTDAITCLEFYEMDQPVRSLPVVSSLESWEPKA